MPVDGLDSRFFAYFLRNAPIRDLGYARHYRLLKEIEIPLPPIPEQQRIVAILDQAFADIEKARANAEQNLKNARELFDSYLQQVFSQRGEGWVEEKMSNVCVGRITDGTHQTPKYFDEGYIFLSSKNVTSGKIDWDNVKYLDETQHTLMQKRLAPRLDDILLAKNGTTGVAAIVDKNVIFNIYVSLALLRPSEKIRPRYLLHFVNSPAAKAQFNKRLKGIGVPNLHLNEIRDVIVSFPTSIDEQSLVVSKVDGLLEKRKKLEDIYENKLASLDELKKSLLQKAFSGELTKGEGRAA
jgi:type I restriction enzyme S subunit